LASSAIICITQTSDDILWVAAACTSVKEANKSVKARKQALSGENDPCKP